MAVHWCWNFCFIIWSRRNIRYISEKQYILIICWICFRFRAFYSFRMEIKPGIWYNLNIKSRFKEVKIYVVSSGCWAIIFTILNLTWAFKQKKSKWFGFISLSLTALTPCLFYSDAAMRVSNEDWGGLTDILPFISKALWVYVIISILVNSITLLGDKK